MPFLSVAITMQITNFETFFSPFLKKYVFGIDQKTKTVLQT